MSMMDVTLVQVGTRQVGTKRDEGELRECTGHNYGIRFINVNDRRKSNHLNKNTTK
jgi:hypothetical protein